MENQKPQTEYAKISQHDPKQVERMILDIENAAEENKEKDDHKS